MALKTEKIQVRVQEDTAAFLRGVSKDRNIPLTELGGALLDYATRAEAEEAGEALIMPTVRQVVRQELDHFLDRIFDFTARIYMEAGTTRRMVMASMLYDMPKGHDGRLERIKQLEEIQWAATWEASRKHFEELRSLKDLVFDSGELFDAKINALKQIKAKDE